MSSVVTHLNGLGKHENTKSPMVFKLLIAITALSIIGLTVGLLIDRLYQPAEFQIKEVALSGNPQHVDQKEVRQEILNALAGNYFSIDMPSIHQAMAKFPWVDTVSVRRRWPDTLMIDIVEHRPIATWSDGKLLTTEGKLVDLPLTDDTWLPVLSGPNDQMQLVYGQFQVWAPAFSKQGLRLVALSLSAQHLWTLTVEVLGQIQSKPFEMVLLESNSSAQLSVFLQSIRQNLIDHPSGIERVDLRYSSGFSIKWIDQNSESQQ